MPGLARRSSAQTDEQAQKQQAPAKDPSQQEPEASNSEKQDELRSKQGTEAGLANYEQALTKWLGGELYKAIAPHLTFEAVSKYADKGLSAALSGSVGALGGLGGEDRPQDQIDEAAIKKFGDALANQYGHLAGEMLETKNGHKVHKALADWVDANPRLIVLAALLAAGGAVLADMKIPEIKTKLDIGGGLSANLSAKLGSLQNMALNEIKTKLQYETGPLMAAVQVTRDAEGDYSGKGEASLGDDVRNIKADIEFTDDGIKAYGVSGLVTTEDGSQLEAGVDTKKGKDPVVSGTLTREDGETKAVNELSYDTNTEVLHFKGTREFLLGDAKASTNLGMGSDGSRQAGFDLKNQLADGLTGNTGVQYTGKPGEEGALDEKTTLSGGLQYKNNQLNTKLDGKVATDGSGSMSSKTTYKPTDDLTLSGQGGYHWGDNERFNLGGGFDYHDDRNRFMANMNFQQNLAKDTEKLDFDLLAQRNFTDDFALRGTAGFTHATEGDEYRAGLHGAYFVDKDVALLGGGRYQLGADGESSFIPEVGAQIKGIPLTIGWDTANKGFVVGAKLKF